MQNFMLSHLKKKKALRKLHFSRSSPDPENYRWDHQGVISFRFLPIFGHFKTSQENIFRWIGRRKISFNREKVLFAIISRGKAFKGNRKKSLPSYI